MKEMPEKLVLCGTGSNFIFTGGPFFFLPIDVAEFASWSF